MFFTLLKAEEAAGLRKKILSFGVSFSDRSNMDYADFLNLTKKTRIKLFDHNIDRENVGQLSLKLVNP